MSRRDLIDAVKIGLALGLLVGLLGVLAAIAHPQHHPGPCPTSDLGATTTGCIR